MKMENTEDFALISIIITTYNRKQFIGRAISTVIAQTYPNKEIIVVDDCSDDDPVDIIKEFDFPIRYSRQKLNSGVSAARNKGIEIAQGEYIAFLDDDDLWVANKLEKQLAMLDEFDACLCAVQFQNSDKTVVQNVSEVTHDMLRYGNHFCGPGGLLIKKEPLEHVVFEEDFRFSEDWEFYYRLTKRYKLGYCKEPLLLYNRGEHLSLINAAKFLEVDALDGRLGAIKKHRQDLGEKLYRRRVASIALAYIFSKKKRMSFLIYSIKNAGFITTSELLIRKIMRRERIFYN